MGRKFKIGAAVTAGAAVAFIFARGVKAIIDDMKLDEMPYHEEDDDEDEFFEDEDIMKENDDACDGCDGTCGKCEAHKNFTEPEDTAPVEENADEAAAQAVSSENMTEVNA